MGAKSRINCPSCGRLLDIERSEKGVLIWCAFGPCESYRANSGALGDNEARAYLILADNIDEETQERMNGL